ncbi:CUB domain-containing protein [Caenorhabditis elegans]|uniref:CUB domain-containing protein n=1 Tax=Caenorhabditis elegans TaxID=6239 RepID=Q18665_CAEEL|nr:CUB domain-containing protein [Caenorhabditis elegans]CAA93763.2 CUB domain-containing protein [Caenorhabditis elegans]|eukprot:NP_496495.2 Uncharacterized protein CELE_C47D12.5 [Caenorhabditis elegans]
MLLTKLLCLVILLGLVHSEQWSRVCAQCVAGNFLTHRRVMQNSSAGQSMGFVDEWKGTDCVSGTIHSIPCENSCITIVLKKIHEEDENAFEGIMMDCSDQLIVSSPDLPQGIQFTNYNQNGVFSNHRSNLSITYSFTTDSFQNAEKIRRSFSSVVLPSYEKEYEISTIVALIGFSVLVVSLCCSFCIYSYCYEKKLREARNDKVIYQKRLLDNSDDSPTSSNDTENGSVSSSAPEIVVIKSSIDSSVPLLDVPELQETEKKFLDGKGSSKTL